MDTIDLSVIIPCYNLERYISKMIQSLEKQDTGIYSVEYIFVDNNCTDDTVRIIAESKLNPLKIIHCTDQGCGCARNEGLKYAEGKYIWFMDGDDWLLWDDAIQRVLDLLYAGNLDIVRVPYSSTFREYFSMVWQYVFSRELIGDTRFASIQPCEDDLFTKQILEKMHIPVGKYRELIPTVPVTLYYYNYLREGSNMQRYFSKGKI